MATWYRQTTVDNLVSGLTLHVNGISSNSAIGIDVLRDASSPGAALNWSHYYDRRCFPGTREQYIADITNWVLESVNTPSSMYWMRGPAGVGKSAIARTSRKWAPRSCILFHCQRAQQFLAVVYYNRLPTHDTLPDYRADVEYRTLNNNAIVEKKMPSQSKLLIVEPLQELEKQGKRVQPKAIFIDGLDETLKQKLSR